jgi:hypothetical protein
MPKSTDDKLSDKAKELNKLHDEEAELDNEDLEDDETEEEDDEDFEYEHSLEFVTPIIEEIVYNINNFYVDESGYSTKMKLRKVKLLEATPPIYGYRIKLRDFVLDEPGGILVESFAATVKKNIKSLELPKDNVIVLYLEDK